MRVYTTKNINKDCGDDGDGSLNLNDLIDQLTSYKLPNLAMLQLYEGIKERRLWIEIVDDFLVDSVVKTILKYNKEDRDIPIEDRIPIKLLFNSPGGHVDICDIVIDVITMSKTPIIGINMGICYSAGALMFLACNERYALPRAGYLIHQGTVDMRGQTQSVLDHTANLEEKEKEIRNYVLSRTSIDEKTYKKNIRKEWYFSIEEQLKFGIINKVVDDIEIII